MALLALASTRFKLVQTATMMSLLAQSLLFHSMVALLLWSIGPSRTLKAMMRRITILKKLASSLLSKLIHLIFYCA